MMNRRTWAAVLMCVQLSVSILLGLAFSAVLVQRWLVVLALLVGVLMLAVAPVLWLIARQLRLMLAVMAVVRSNEHAREETLARLDEILWLVGDSGSRHERSKTPELRLVIPD